MSQLNKQTIFLFIITFFLTISGSYAQAIKKQFLDTLDLGMAKNTYLKVSSTRILSLDLGGDEGLILMEEDNGVIKLKAIKEKFPETNLLVICKDTLLQFIVRYEKLPKKTIYEYDLLTLRSKPNLIAKQNISTAALMKPNVETIPDNTKGKFEKSESISVGKPKTDIKLTSYPDFKLLSSQKANISLGEVKEGIKLRLMKLYVKDESMYFGMNMNNSTPIDYNIDYVSFEVRSKSSALAATSLQSVYPTYKEPDNNANQVPAQGSVDLSYEIEKFGLRSDEILVITIFERSSASKGRSYTIKINSNDFSRIKKLN